MPEISRFLGIRIFMYYEEHSPPHFHANYAGQVAVLDIASLAVLRGDLPGRALGLVVEWGRLHREELEANWTRARQAEPLLAVEPLGWYRLMLQVRAVEVLEGYWLRLTLSNGDVVERNVQDLIRGGVFEPLRQRRELFEAAFVEGSTVAWPGEVDIAPETLIWDGPEPDDRAVRPKRRLRVHRVTRRAMA